MSNLLLDIERLGLIRVLCYRMLLKSIPLRPRCDVRGFGPCWHLGRGAEARCVFCGQPPK